jgi:drug/metabolite transporter (DMT)-like permease
MPPSAVRSLHWLGVLCGLTAGAWLGAAEAPTKLIMVGLSPYLISLAMVAGVFVGRWTLPTIMKGTGYVFRDLGEKPHLVVWAILAGALWAVANTLTVFAIRDVGLSIAFPLWNTNTLVGVFWGWFFFRELRGAGLKDRVKVLGGAAAIVVGAFLLGYASSHQASSVSHRALAGIAASMTAALLWGTMYIPYRKAYVSGMNPLSFVTVFTVGELTTMTALALVFRGGLGPLLEEIKGARPALFWIFLGGFCWVIGDLFLHYAAKYIGIGRGIPLANTDQLWGLAWGVLVFGELSGQRGDTQVLVMAGSLVMILGAAAISMAVAPDAERAARRTAVARECERYDLRFEQAEASLAGEDPLSAEAPSRRWWDALIVATAFGVFVWLARGTKRPSIPLDVRWTVVLVIAMLAMLTGCGMFLWKRTNFS